MTGMYYNKYGTARDTTSDGKVTYYQTVHKTSLYPGFLKIFTVLAMFKNGKVREDYKAGKFNAAPEFQVPLPEFDLVLLALLPSLACCASSDLMKKLNLAEPVHMEKIMGRSTQYLLLAYDTSRMYRD